MPQQGLPFKARVVSFKYIKAIKAEFRGEELNFDSLAAYTYNIHCSIEIREENNN